jgi:hypothetical protein
MRRILKYNNCLFPRINYFKRKIISIKWNLLFSIKFLTITYLYIYIQNNIIENNILKFKIEIIKLEKEKKKLFFFI